MDMPRFHHSLVHMGMGKLTKPFRKKQIRPPDDLFKKTPLVRMPGEFFYHNSIDHNFPSFTICATRLFAANSSSNDAPASTHQSIISHVSALSFRYNAFKSVTSSSPRSEGLSFRIY